jgi:protein-S-isoprenylcysteine O-methyltransferase Ste14
VIPLAATQLSFGMYAPLLLVAFVYVVLRIVAYTAEGRGSESSERYQDLAFVVALLMAVYVVVLVVVAAVSFPNSMSKMIEVLVIVCAFFGLLAVVLLAITDYGFGAIGRARKRRRGVDVFD